MSTDEGQWSVRIWTKKNQRKFKSNAFHVHFLNEIKKEVRYAIQKFEFEVIEDDDDDWKGVEFNNEKKENMGFL